MFDASWGKAERVRGSRVRTRFSLTLSVGLACAALGCGPASTARAPAVSTASPAQPGTASPELSTAEAPSADRPVASESSRPGVDRRDPRVAAAGAAVAALVGHPIEVTIDAALTARLGDSAQAAFVRALEALVDGVRQVKGSNAEALAYAAPLWRQVTLQYEPSSQAPAPVLEASGILRVRVPPHDLLLSAYDVKLALYNAFDTAGAARYAGREPESIPPSEQRAYYRYLSDSHKRPGLAPGVERSPLDRLGRLLRLYDRLVDTELRIELRHRLARFASSLSEMRREGATDAWTAAQKAYVTWVNDHGADLDFGDRSEISKAMFADLRIDPGHAMRQGLDLVRFAIPILQAFVGAPRDSVGRDGESHDDFADRDEQEVEEVILCPAFSASWLEETSGNHRSCRGDFYAEVFDGPNGASALAHLLERFPNERLTVSAILNLLVSKGTDDVLAVIAASDDTRAQVALRALGQYTDWPVGGQAKWVRYGPNGAEPVAPAVEPVLAWIRREWPLRPSLHGAMLYALARLDAGGDSLVPWGRLATWLGASIGAADFASFLDQGGGSMMAIALVGRGLGTGWSRARVIIPRFEAWITRLKPLEAFVYSTAVTEDILQALCRNDSSDVATFHAWVGARIKAYPVEANRYSRVPNATPAALCAKDPNAISHPTALPALEPPIDVHAEVPVPSSATGSVTASPSRRAPPSSVRVSPVLELFAD